MLEKCLNCEMPLPRLEDSTLYWCPSCGKVLRPRASLPESLYRVALDLLVEGEDIHQVLEQLSRISELTPGGEEDDPDAVSFAKVMRFISASEMLDYLQDVRLLDPNTCVILLARGTPKEKVDRFVERLERYWKVSVKQETDQLEPLAGWKVFVSCQDLGTGGEGSEPVSRPDFAGDVPVKTKESSQ